MKTVLLTRPLEQATESIKRLEARGIRAFSAPMLSIKPVSFMPIPDHTSLILTSQNAAKIALPTIENPDTLIYAVGERTAKTAKDLGFKNIIVGARDGAALAQLIRNNLPTTSHPIVHLAGKDIAFDIVTDLRAHNIAAERRIVYEAVPLNSLNTAIITKLMRQEIDMVLFYSPRGATIFEKTIHKHGEIDWLKNLRAVSLSSQIDASLQAEWLERVVAKAPTEVALFDCL